MTDFRALGVSEAVCELLAARGIDAPFQIQSLVIPEALRGRRRPRQEPDGLRQDARVRDPDRPAADTDGTPSALVLVPTRELCVQVTEEFALIAGDRRATSRRSTAACR